MREDLPIETVSTTSLDPQIQQLIRDVKLGKVRITFVDEDGRKLAEAIPVDEDGREDIWAGYDPEAARKAWHESAGILRGVDVEALLAELKAERG